MRDFYEVKANQNKNYFFNVVRSADNVKKVLRSYQYLFVEIYGTLKSLNGKHTEWNMRKINYGSIFMLIGWEK